MKRLIPLGIIAFVGLLIWQFNSNSVGPDLGLMRIRPVVAATEANAKSFRDPSGNEIWLGPQRVFGLSKINPTFNEAGNPAIGFQLASYDWRVFQSYLKGLDGKPFAVLHNDEVICLPAFPADFSSTNLLEGGDIPWTEQQAKGYLKGLTEGLRKIGTDEEPVGAVHLHLFEGSSEDFMSGQEDFSASPEIKMHLVPIRKMWAEDDFKEGLVIKLEPTTAGLTTIINSCRAELGQGVVLTSNMIQWYIPPMVSMKELTLEVGEEEIMARTRKAIHVMRGVVANVPVGQQ